MFSVFISPAAFRHFQSKPADDIYIFDFLPPAAALRLLRQLFIFVALH